MTKTNKVAYAPNKDSIQPGPGCSKLTMSLVNVSLKFQMLISDFFNKNISVLVIKS